MDKSIEAAIDAGVEEWNHGCTVENAIRAAIAAYRDTEIERLTAENNRNLQLLKGYAVETGELRAELEQAKSERDEARRNYQFMVNRAADEKLAGYRELGKRAADAENERDALRAKLEAAERMMQEAATALLPDTMDVTKAYNILCRPIKAARGGERG